MPCNIKLLIITTKLIMKNHHKLISTLTVGQFLDTVKPLIKADTAKQLKLPNGIATSNGITILTRIEAAKMLKITLPTLSIHTKKGKIPSYNIGRRVYYKPNEIMSSLEPNIK